MCCTFTPDCGYDNSTINLIGDVYCPDTKCLGKLCLRKKTFQSLGRSNYQCPQCASLCQVRKITFNDQKIPFSCPLVKWFTFLKRVRAEFMMLLEMSIVQVTIGSTEKCERLGCYLTTPRYIYGCGKCGTWLLVHKDPFMLSEHVKTTKTNKTRFFLVKKFLICYPTNNCSLGSLLGTISHQS